MNMNKQDYFRMMEDSHIKTDSIRDCGRTSRLEYLAEYIFDFTTYETQFSELFAKRALEVCSAINKNETFEYIEKLGCCFWYSLMVNMPFFVDKLEWGDSICGAWWDGESSNEKIQFSSCGLFLGDKQVIETLEFTREEWREFIDAVIMFGAD